MGWQIDINDIAKAAIIGIGGAILLYIKKKLPIVIRWVKNHWGVWDKVVEVENEVYIVRQTWEAYMDIVPDPMYLMDNAGNLIYINPAYQEMAMLINAEDAYGKGFMQVVYHEDEARILKLMEQQVKHPFSTSGKVRFQPMGTDKIVNTEYRSALIKQKDGKHIFTIGRLKIIHN